MGYSGDAAGSPLSIRGELAYCVDREWGSGMVPSGRSAVGLERAEVRSAGTGQPRLTAAGSHS